MPKKKLDNVDLCRRFADIRKDKKPHKNQFAEDLGVNQSVVGDIELGYREPSREVLHKLAKVYNVNINWLLTGEGEKYLSNQEKSLVNTQKPRESYKVRLLQQKVSCGPGIDWQNDDSIVDYIDVFDQIPRLKIERLFALRVEGSSMLGAGIRNGDYVLFNPAKDQWPHDDGIYVIALDGDVYCKRIEIDMAKIKIYSVRVADLEKAELMATLDRKDTSTADRLNVFGRVLYWIHPNLED